MKITDTTPNGRVPAPGPGRTNEGQGGKGEFREIMERIMPQENAPAGAAKGPASAPPPDGVSITPGVTETRPSARKSEILSRVRETIDTVDFYAARLGDPGIPAEDMGPLVGHLESRMTELEEAARDRELPREVRTMLSDLAAGIGSEVAKFGRGDYD